MTNNAMPDKHPGRDGPDFMRVLAHELRNHIAPIQNAMHLLRLRSRTDQTFLPAVEIIERQLVGMIRTLDAVGEADRVTRGRAVLERSPITVQALVDQALQAVKVVTERRAHPVEVMLPAELPLVDVDASRMTRVLAILLDNAARYTPPDKAIRLTAAPVDAAMEISIRDEGPGVPPQVLSHAFVFFAAPDEPGHGLGIGLPLAKALMDLHGGALDITRPAVGGGTQVTLRLPRVGTSALQSVPQPASLAAVLAHSAEDIAAPARPTTGASQRQGRRVLVADDSPAVRASLADLLQELGHEVRAVADGAEAVTMAEEWRPEFVLLDIHMPKLNGFEAARRLRAVFPATAMQLVMMSGDDLDGMMRRAALEAGFDHCVDKGLAIGDLTRLLDRGIPD